MGKEIENWESRDLEYIWHPAAQMKDYEELPPMVIERGKGVWLYDIHGRKYLDIVSSWWANLLGHANPRINAAIKEQIDRARYLCKFFACACYRTVGKACRNHAEASDKISL